MSTKYKRKQITLPLEDAGSMSVEQLQQLIMAQGRRVPILDWELNLLLADCTKRMCLDKGLAILYEYAGHMDVVKRLVDVRHETAIRLFQRASGSSTLDAEVDNLLVELSHVNLNIMIALGNLRALQFSPKSILTPITTPVGGGSSSKTLLEADTRSKRVPLDACLREEARILERVYSDAIRKIPLHCGVILLAPKLQFDNIVDVLLQGSSQEGAKQSRLLALEAPARAIANVVSIEDDITTAYKVIRSTVKTPQSPFNELQTLRLNYPDHVPPGTYAWFGKALEVYSPSVITMASAMEQCKIPVTKLGVSSKSAKKVGKEGDYAIAEEKVDRGGDDPFGETAAMIDVSDKRHLAVPMPSAAATAPGRPMTSSAISSAQDSSGRGVVASSSSAPSSPMQVTLTASAVVPAAPQTSPLKKEVSKGSVKVTRSNSGRARPGSAKLMSTTAPLAATSSGSNRDLRRDLFESREGEDDEQIYQSSPSKHGRLDGAVQPHDPIVLDYSFVGGGVGSGVGTPTGKAGSKRSSRASSPSKKPDIKARVGHTGGRSSSGSRNVSFSGFRDKDKDREKRKGEGSSTRVKQAKVLSTKAHDALSFMSLASGPNIGFSKGESKIESQVLQINLKTANVSGQALVRLAARKISHWWHFIGPRRKLYRRMQTYKMVRSLVVDVVNESALKTLKRRRTKAQILRNGSAITIQRLLRHWFYVVRRRTAPRGGWRNRGGRGDPYAVAGMNASGALMEYSLHSGGSEVMAGDSSPGTPRFKGKSFMTRTASQMQIGEGRSHSKEGGKKKRWNKHIAASAINGFFRMILARRKVSKIRERKKAEIKAKKKKMMTFSREKGAKLIQTQIRGSLARNMIYKWVRSSWIIGRAWRRHLAYKRLRADLRRLEKPRIVQLFSIRNLPRQFGNIDKMQIKILVYWPGLLHIFVSEQELRSCIKGKKPQFITYSSIVKVVKQGSGTRDKNSRGSIFERMNPFGDGSAGPKFPSLSLSGKAKSNLGNDAAGAPAGGTITYEANFGGESIRIPGTHGNSIITFEILADEEIVAESTFLMSFHGDLMIWNEETQSIIKYRSDKKGDGHDKDGHKDDDKSFFDFNTIEKQQVQKARRTNSNTTPKFDLAGPPAEVHWRLNSGVPLTSRCGGVKVKVSAGLSLSSSGRGPIISAMYREYGILRTTITSWRKMFMSFDGDEICLWASHNASKPVAIITKEEIAATFLKLGKPTQPYANTVIIEDNFDLNLYTTGHEMLSFRFTDPSSRVRWNETLTYALRGYTSFKAIAGNDSGTVGSDEDNYGRLVSDGEALNIPGRSRISMIAANASSALEGLAGKISGFHEELTEHARPQGRRRRASKLVDALAVQSLASGDLLQIPDTQTDSDSDDDSDESSDESDKSDQE